MNCVLQYLIKTNKLYSRLLHFESYHRYIDHILRGFVRKRRKLSDRRLFEGKIKAVCKKNVFAELMYFVSINIQNNSIFFTKKCQTVVCFRHVLFLELYLHLKFRKVTGPKEIRKLYIACSDVFASFAS